MRKMIWLLLASNLVLNACQQDDSSTGPRDVEQYSIEQFMDNEAIGGASFSADESKILFNSNRSGIYNAYSMPIDSGEAVARTNSESNAIFGISYFPNDDRILYRADDNGDEIYHLFMQDPNGNSIELTPDTAARASFYGWAHDRNSFFYGYSKRDPKLTDVYEMNINNFTSEMIFKNDDAYEFGGISDDKKYMALIDPINTNDSDLYLRNMETGEMTKVNEQQSGNLPADFGPDSTYLYYLTDADAEYQYLMRHNLESGEKEKVKEADWDITYAYFSHNGKYMVTGKNVDGRTEVEITETESGDLVELPAFGESSVQSITFADSENKAALYVGTSRTPSNLYVYNFETQNLTQLTSTLNPEIPKEDLVKAEVVRYESFDSLEIPAIYYKPIQASEENKVPALVWVHGGPGGQSRQNFSPEIQYLVNHGYAVLMVNNRGSSGYGKTFYQMDDQKHGEEDLKDCIWGKKWLAEQPYVDTTKIGIIGGSYGGFMVMAAMTQYPQEFEVGVNFFGVTNWLRTLKSIPPWWESFKDALYQEMGDPAVDSARLHSISPLFQADQIQNPIMVLQGANDPRVLQVESDEIVAAARENDVPVEYVVFEDEGHGFVKKENEIEAWTQVMDFLNQYLKGVEPSPETEAETDTTREMTDADTTQQETTTDTTEAQTEPAMDQE